MNLSDYEVTNYKQFLKALHLHKADCDKTEVRLASDIGVKSVLSVRNCFDGSKQIVSDAVLTKLMEVLKLDGIIVWNKGIRYYYIKSKAI